MTTKELISYAIDYLDSDFKNNLEIEVLLASVMDLSKEELFLNADAQVSAPEVELFKKYMARLKGGEPIAYILNKKEFFGLDFFVDNRVLVPRPESEHIVEKTLEYMERERNESGKNSFRVLDIGTGSGNIIIAIVNTALQREFDIEGIGLDVSDEAIEVARINCDQHSLSDNLGIFQSNLLEVTDEAEHFDVIVANLPYIGEEKHRYIEGNVEKFEPHIALFGGKDGLELYRNLFEQIKEKEITFGLMLGEFGFAQTENMEKILSEHFEENHAIIKDLAGIDRVFVVRGN
ncbi:peptide chain release factor N(5)-glutamine methyltransferase [Candidatus Peregrinibacteria bacterium]|nr:peptide chain release factor N(5)-glutamine methyltransferase [Candidatus Peregrinibacteria bacterium]